MLSALSLRCDSASNTPASVPSPTACAGRSRRTTGLVKAIALGRDVHRPRNGQASAAVEELTAVTEARTLPRGRRHLPSRGCAFSTPAFGRLPCARYNRRHKNTPGGTFCEG